MNKSAAQFFFGMMLFLLFGIIFNEACGCLRNRISSLVDHAGQLHCEIGKQLYSMRNLGIENDPINSRLVDMETRKATIIKTIDQYRSLDAAIRKYADGAIYVILPYLAFSVAFIYTAHRDPDRETRPITYGLAFSSVMCLAVFIYLTIISPVKCNDLGCLIPLVGVPVILLTAGTIMTLVIRFFIIHRIKG